MNFTPSINFGFGIFSTIKTQLFQVEIIEKVENFDSSMITHYYYPNIPIYDDTISIVMTSSNRSRQVYYTLDTIEKCSFKVKLFIG